VTDTMMEIGCQRHTHAAWCRFGKKKIAEMDSAAAKVWEPNKAWLLEACKQQAARAKAIIAEKAA